MGIVSRLFWMLYANTVEHCSRGLKLFFKLKTRRVTIHICVQGKLLSRTTSTDEASNCNILELTPMP